MNFLPHVRTCCNTAGAQSGGIAALAVALGKEDITMGEGAGITEVLESVAGEKEVRLIVPGRKTGKPRSVTIWFVISEASIGLGTLDNTRAWVANARAADRVELKFSRLVLRGTFREVVDPAEHRRLRRAFARKYLPARLLSFVGIGQRATFSIEEFEVLEAS